MLIKKISKILLNIAAILILIVVMWGVMWILIAIATIVKELLIK